MALLRASPLLRTLAHDAAGLRGMATEASKKDIVHFLSNQDSDVEVDSAIKGYMRAAYKAGKSIPPEKPEEVYELSSKVQRKYIAAQIVDSGIQGVSVPLAWEHEGPASLNRYAAQLLSIGAKAGFEEPMVEVRKRVAEKAAISGSAKELLNSIKPYTSPEFHSALMEALASVEADGESVSLDGASAGYKKFAEKVKAVAEAHKLPWKMLLDNSKPSIGQTKEYAAWVQSARVADTKAEISVLQAEATALLDRHLTKSAQQIKQEQEAAMAALHKRIEANKGAAWAEQYKKDLAALAAYDAQCQADPVNGPKISA
uniref:Uncharacterized protein n=1 Tax=Dunaliella tertiolecta TaxID=3047 RepID=A0A7S3R9S3_DUNTE|mmetsp:Transcript_5367/g.14454  ORF Transcript_5367/g.14454 Transcript_5367/m.14454 type:complete len:315 (-) Transcript_5367:339-1283(-)|eukprot:CAMPEP_0202351846 /NCGR_PEP_ID=MMETSP1126-20121109/8301_1 /ASSEMBLY_ACC=CAM_ASM_000457 /TAXON_ID=3047 /ORGANISM="Dunaliella tertiolecta, Strain CCMP1320" /LENGTH=314 /DNA_ID=CAMNT_0048943991 /DNA_START=34 /DNA_END=978 /DNA_ORIENTATION=-